MTSTGNHLMFDKVMCFFVYGLVILGFYTTPLIWILAFFLADANTTKEGNSFYDGQYQFLNKTLGYWLLWVTVGFGLVVLDIGLVNNFDYKEVIEATKLDELINFHPINSFFFNNKEIESEIYNYVYSIFGFQGPVEKMPDIINMEVLNNLTRINYKEALITVSEAGNHWLILLTTLSIAFVFIINCLFWPIYRIIFGLWSLIFDIKIENKA